MTASDLPIQPLAALPDTLSEDVRLYLRPGPLRVVDRGDSSHALPLGRTGLSFDACEVILRRDDRIGAALVPVFAVHDWVGALSSQRAREVQHLLSRLSEPGDRAVAGPTESPRLMGILNVTPDSFFDGGRYDHVEGAVAQASRLRDEGADILDIGGESTRPGADPVSEAEELRRVVPLLDALAGEDSMRDVVLSVDSQKAAVMEAALERGATMINDVSALTADPNSLAVAAASDAKVVLMHRQGGPQDMNLEPRYENAPLEVFDWLAARVAACEAAGIARHRLLVDPGIGFGKGSGHTLEILRRLSLFHGLGCTLLLGLSRKGLTGALDRSYPPEARLPGSLAAALHALDHGTGVLRVHDVAATWQAIEVWARLNGLKGWSA